MKTTLIATAFILKLVSISEAHRGEVVRTLPEIQIRSGVHEVQPEKNRTAATDSAFTAVMLQLDEAATKKLRAAQEKSKLQSHGTYAVDLQLGVLGR